VGDDSDQARVNAFAAGFFGGMLGSVCVATVSHLYRRRRAKAAAEQLRRRFVTRPPATGA
jgi:hypothetical protein